MVKVGLIVDGETELKIFNSHQIKAELKKSGIQIVSVVKYKSGKISTYTDNLKEKGACKIFILKDLEQMPCISSLKKQLTENETISSDNILLVVKKMIEAWFLADTNTLKKIIKKKHIKPVSNPEIKSHPFNELKKITKRNFSKVNMAQMFLNNGFSIEGATSHSQCSSAQRFINELKKIKKECN